MSNKAATSPPEGIAVDSIIGSLAVRGSDRPGAELVADRGFEPCRASAVTAALRCGPRLRAARTEPFAYPLTSHQQVSNPPHRHDPPRHRVPRGRRCCRRGAVRADCSPGAPLRTDARSACRRAACRAASWRGAGASRRGCVARSEGSLSGVAHSAVGREASSGTSRRHGGLRCVGWPLRGRDIDRQVPLRGSRLGFAWLN